MAEHPIKPWQYQSWIYPRDPDFAAKATVILDLYQGYYQGKRLHRATGSSRWTPSPPSRPAADAATARPPAAGRSGWSTNTSAGALALLAALDVHTGKVFASAPATTGIAPFTA